MGEKEAFLLPFPVSLLGEKEIRFSFLSPFHCWVRRKPFASLTPVSLLVRKRPVASLTPVSLLDLYPGRRPLRRVLGLFYTQGGGFSEWVSSLFYTQEEASQGGFSLFYTQEEASQGGWEGGIYPPWYTLVCLPGYVHPLYTAVYTPPSQPVCTLSRHQASRCG